MIASDHTLYLYSSLLIESQMVNTEIILLGNYCDCLIEANLTASGHTTTISCPHHLWSISKICWNDGVCQAFVALRWDYVLSCFNLTDGVQFVLIIWLVLKHLWLKIEMILSCLAALFLNRTSCSQPWSLFLVPCDCNRFGLGLHLDVLARAFCTIAKLWRVFVKQNNQCINHAQHIGLNAQQWSHCHGCLPRSWCKFSSFFKTSCLFAAALLIVSFGKGRPCN